MLAEGVVVVRPLGQRREVGDLRQRQVVDRLVEVGQRRGGDAVGIEAEENLVEVEFEDALLRVGLLDAQRQDRFLDLAVEGLLGGEQEVLRHLLRDRRGADQPRAAAGHVLQHGAGDAVKIEAGVLVEILVLGGDERLLDAVGNRLDRQVEPALVGVLGHQLAVVGVDARRHRRLVLGEHVVVRQVRGQPGDVPGNTRCSGQKEHGTDPE